MWNVIKSLPLQVYLAFVSWNSYFIYKNYLYNSLEVYRMWDFQYSRIRMRILHFNIRGYRMRMQILYILFYKGYKNQFWPQMMKKTQKIMQLLN